MDHTVIFTWLEKTWLVGCTLLIEAGIAFYNGSVDLRSARYHNCILYIFNAVTGTMAWWGIARIICKKMSKVIVWGDYLSIIGIAYVCMNQVFILIGKSILDLFDVDNLILQIVGRWMVFLFVLIIIGVINELVCKTKIRFVLGRML